MTDISIFDIETAQGTIAPNGVGRIQSTDSTEQLSQYDIKAEVTFHRQTGTAISTDRLYAANTGRGRLVLRARTLLEVGAVRLERAQECLATSDLVGADYEVTLFQGDLPELFCCNSLSDGFAALIVSFHHALRNRGGDPLTVEQAFALRACVRQLSDEIFMPYDTALDLIDRLEDAGLRTDPSQLAETVSAILSHESNR